jgi:hypothetical protein
LALRQLALPRRSIILSINMGYPPRCGKPQGTQRWRLAGPCVQRA